VVFVIVTGVSATVTVRSSVELERATAADDILGVVIGEPSSKLREVWPSSRLALDEITVLLNVAEFVVVVGAWESAVDGRFVTWFMMSDSLLVLLVGSTSDLTNCVACPAWSVKVWVTSDESRILVASKGATTTGDGSIANIVEVMKTNIPLFERVPVTGVVIVSEECTGTWIGVEVVTFR
jgi:hypothetical protein